MSEAGVKYLKVLKFTRIMHLDQATSLKYVITKTCISAPQNFADVGYFLAKFLIFFCQNVHICNTLPKSFQISCQFLENIGCKKKLFLLKLVFFMVFYHNLVLPRRHSQDFLKS